MQEKSIGLQTNQRQIAASALRPSIDDADQSRRHHALIIPAQPYWIGVKMLSLLTVDGLSLLVKISKHI